MTNFSLEEIEKTFTNYKKGNLESGVVVFKRDDGVVFNIGGKKDAFILKEDFPNYDEIKIGDRFKVVIKGTNDEGMILASKSEADVILIGIQNAQKLKLGSRFTFVPTRFDGGLHSKMGDYDIFVPASEISSHYVDTKKMIGKQFEAVVTELDRDNKSIVASIKLLADQIAEANAELFWKSIFINKIVTGNVKKILPYGAFVDVGGVDCFVHISDLSFSRISSPSDVISEGQELNFKVIEVDRENKKVKLGLKQILPDPIIEKIENLVVGETYDGEVTKLLAFGAIIKLDSGVTGLLHISNATERHDANIYEFVKLGQRVSVKVLSKDIENKKVSFGL